jgi:hypothetical protein
MANKQSSNSSRIIAGQWVRCRWTWWSYSNACQHLRDSHTWASSLGRRSQLISSRQLHSHPGTTLDDWSVRFPPFQRGRNLPDTLASTHFSMELIAILTCNQASPVCLLFQTSFRPLLLCSLYYYKGFLLDRSNSVSFITSLFLTCKVISAFPEAILNL